MSPELLAKVKQSVIEHEGYRRFPYVDTVGKITVGIGYNLTDRGMDDEWITTQCEKDIEYFHEQLNKNFPWFKFLNPDRQVVLIDMCFMGFKRFLGFKKMISALEKNDFVTASMEMLASKWAAQVGNRALELAAGMRRGVYNPHVLNL